MFFNFLKRIWWVITTGISPHYKISMKIENDLCIADCYITTFGKTRHVVYIADKFSLFWASPTDGEPHPAYDVERILNRLRMNKLMQERLEKAKV